MGGFGESESLQHHDQKRRKRRAEAGCSLVENEYSSCRSKHG